MLLPDEPLEPAHVVASIWTPEELGDPRRHRRLTRIVDRLLRGDEGETGKETKAAQRGTSRFWANPHVVPAALEASSRKRLGLALALPTLPIIVLAHDTSEIDEHGRNEPADAGPLRSNSARGYLLHGCAVVDLRHKALVGILDNWAWNRSWDLQVDDRKQRAPKDKESYKWIRGLKRSRAQLKAAGFTGRAINACDREADDYKVYAYARRAKADLVVRAASDRAIAQHPERLWAYVAAQPPVLSWTLKVSVERQRAQSPEQAAARVAKAIATRTRKRAVHAEARARQLEGQTTPLRGGAAAVATARAQATQTREVARQAEAAAITATATAKVAAATIRHQGPLLARIPSGPTTRMARVELRYAQVKIQPTNPKEGTRAIPLSAVFVREVAPPAGMVPVEWMLLTTLPVNTAEDAVFVVDCYKARWGCEEFHKILKSGLDLEGQHVKDLQGFQRVLAVLTPIASHLARWTHAARVTPHEPAAGHVAPATLLALGEASLRHGLPLPPGPWTIADVLGRLAELGGYEPRRDRRPGWMVIWRGWRVLQTFWTTYEFAQQRGKQAEG